MFEVQSQFQHQKNRLATLAVALISLVFFSPLAASAQSVSAEPPPTNIRVTNYSQLNNEEQVFFSPIDSNILISVWRDFRLGYRQVGIGRSADGGQTWVDSLIEPDMQYINQLFGPPDIAWQSDPTLTVDAAGNFYISVLDFSSTSPNLDSGIIAFYKSIDSGQTWTGPVANAPVTDWYFEDKQFITADRTGGAHDGNVYLSWTRFPNPNRIVFQRSIDGAQSFEDTVVVGPKQTSTGCGGAQIAAGQFSIPVVDAEGGVHVFWQGTRLDSVGACVGGTAIKHVVSVDGGQTFTYADDIVEVSGWTSSPGGVSTYSQPVVDVDIFGGPFHGNMYLTYTNIGPEDAGRSDVDFQVSTDKAQNWTDRQQVNDFSASGLADAFHPWLVVNQEGVVAMIFYDNRLDPPMYYDFDLIAAYSFDGGLTISSNHRITTVSSNPDNLASSSLERDPPVEYMSGIDDPDVARLASPQAGKIGEYIGLTAFYDKLNATWTDSRDFNSEVYTANWYIPLLETRLLAPADGSHAAATDSLHWATAWKHDQDRYRWEIASDAGFAALVDSGSTDTVFADLGGSLPDGEYFWRVKSMNTSETDSAEYSVTYDFTIDGTPPSAPALVTPDSGAVLLDSVIAFDWTDAVDGVSAVTYSLLVSTTDAFTPGPQTLQFNDLVISQHTPAAFTAGEYFWKAIAFDAVLNSTESEVFSFEYIEYVCGDADGSGSITIADVTFSIARIFSGGPESVPPEAADADGSGSLTIADVTYTIAHIFSGGPAPVCP